MIQLTDFGRPETIAQFMAAGSAPPLTPPLLGFEAYAHDADVA